MMQYQHRLIRKAIEHYKYNEPAEVKLAAEKYFENYPSRYKNYKKNKYNFNTFFGTLTGWPESTHSAAKKMLWQGNDQCWKYFERTALFWTVSNINDEWIDHLKSAFEYALYVERNDILEMLIRKTQDYLALDVYKTSKEHKNQPVYPSTYLVHFLTEKWLGNNPALEQVLKFGKGYAIYQPLIDNWNDYTKIGADYWNELCEYHLNQLSLTKPDKRDGEEFIGAGLVPMELINLFKVRKKLGLDVPEINHELFKTPMAIEPNLPSGYREDYDIIYQTVKRTAETQKQYTYEEMVDYIKQTYGIGENLILQ
jgi:hypothetical protein